jgi:hypothetical protein
MMGRYRHTVTQIVASVYCEQKVVFDRRHGKATPRELQVKAASGAFEHLRFQWEGYTRNPGRRLVKIAEGRQATDSRCFIASQVYGADAPETNALRAWRDRTLMPNRIGRAIVTTYYWLSPIVVPILRRSARLTSIAKCLLDRIRLQSGGGR